MYFVYIIYSANLNSYYVGQTNNLSDRLLRHNTARSKYTSKASDWRLVYSEEFKERSEAVRREKDIKSKKSRRYIDNLIGSQIDA